MNDSIFNDAIDMTDIPREQWKDYINNGYRSVFYNTNFQTHVGQIFLMGYDKQDNPKLFIFPWRSHVKFTVRYKTAEQDIYGNYVETRTFNNIYDRKRWIDTANGINIIEALRPEQEFLHDLFDANVLDDTFNKQPVRIQFIDIETEISEQFERPADARNRINMITVYDNFTDKYYTWSLQHADVEFHDHWSTLSPKKISVDISDNFGNKDIHYYEDDHKTEIELSEDADIRKQQVEELVSRGKSIQKFMRNNLKDYSKDKFVFKSFHDDEAAMLTDFIDWVSGNYPDISAGWNTQAYDWPYIVRRIENVLGNSEAQRLSPFGKYRIKEVNHDNERANQSAEIEVIISGLFIADLLVLYRDKFQVTAALDGGYGLSNVGEHEGLGRKIDYDGSLKDLYLKDYQKFYEYNVRDVDLVVKIEEKCKLISLSRQIASFGLCGYDSIYTSISYLIGSVLSFARTEMGGKILPSYMAEKRPNVTFEGAFVFPPIAGLYKGGTGTIDFASLYPNTIRSINASPETYVGRVKVYMKVTEDSGEVIIESTDPLDIDNEEQTKKVIKLLLEDAAGRCTPITIDQIKQLRATKCIWTRNNTLFIKHEIKEGVIAKWCEHFYFLRKKTKKVELTNFHRLHNETDLAEDIVKALTVEMDNKHVAQIGIKNMINSIYGCLGTAFSPIFNPHIAQTITRQGRFCNQSTEKFIRRRWEEDYHISSDYPVAISGDTDSIFLNLSAISSLIAKERNIAIDQIKDWPEDAKQKLWDITSKFINSEVNDFVRKLITDYCGTKHADVLSYELEYMTSAGIFESKKHYGVYKIFEEGDRVDKFKFSGIELKKASVPKQMKVYLKDFYEGVLTKNWTFQNYKSYICDLYEQYKNFDIDDIALWKGYSTARESVGFLTMATGTTGIAKACTYYNQLIKKLKIAEKYEEILVGDKVRFLYIDPSNKYGIECLAFKDGQYPKEFEQLFRPDYRKMFAKLITEPLKNYRIACHFPDVDPTDQMVEDIFDM